MYWQAKAFAVEIRRENPQTEVAPTAVVPRSHVHAVSPRQWAACGQRGQDMYPLGQEWEAYDAGVKCPRCSAVLGQQVAGGR